MPLQDRLVLRRHKEDPFASLDQLNEQANQPRRFSGAKLGATARKGRHAATAAAASAGRARLRSASPPGAGGARQQLLGALTTDISSRNWEYARKTFRRNTSAASTERDADGNTPLHWIMRAPDPVPLDFAELVLASYPEAAAVQEHTRGSTPLHIACEEYKLGAGEKVEMVLDLAGHTGVAATRDHAGRLPLDILLERLEAHRVRLTFPPLRVLSLFPEFLALWTATYGECVAAAAMKNWDAVRRLLRSKVEGPMQQDFFGMIPIDYAVKYDAPRRLLALLARAYPASEGVVLLPLLQGRHWRDAVELLNRNPVAGEWRDDRGRVALNHAFAHGADVDVLQDMRIATPESVAAALAFALEKGHPKMARALMQAGCDIKFYLEDFKHESSHKAGGPLAGVNNSSSSSSNNNNNNGGAGGSGGGGGDGFDASGGVTMGTGGGGEAGAADGLGEDDAMDDDGVGTNASRRNKRTLPVKDALVAAHTILSATLTDIDVPGTSNALGMIFSRHDVMEYHRRMMENQGLRSMRSNRPALNNQTSSNNKFWAGGMLRPATAPTHGDEGGDEEGNDGGGGGDGSGGGGDDDDDDNDSDAVERRRFGFLFHRFDEPDTPGTLHYKAARTLARVYERMERVQKDEKLGAVTKPISDWVFAHVHPALVPPHRRDARFVLRGSKVARTLQQPADLVLRQDRMPKSVRAVATSATGGVALTGSAEDVELLPSTSCAFVTEKAYAHILHLLACSLDEAFHKTVGLVLTDRVQGCRYVAAPPKAVAKMVSNIATRHAAMKRPRPAHNVDCLRCLVNYVDATQLLDGFAQLQANFQILHVTNGYADWYDARPEFGFRAVTLHIVYEPKMTFGQMAARASPQVRSFLAGYVASVEPEQRPHAKVALEWLQHQRIARKDVRMIAEVQLVYGPYVAECKVKSNVYRLILEAKTAQKLHEIFAKVGNPLYHRDEDRSSQHDALARYREGYQRLLDHPRTPVEQASLDLLEATKRGDVRLMARLLRQRADVNFQHPKLHNWTPLHIAVFHGQRESIRFLLTAGADVQVEDTWEDRPEDYSSIILELEDEIHKNPFGNTAAALLPVGSNSRDGDGDGDGGGDGDGATTPTGNMGEAAAAASAAVGQGQPPLMLNLERTATSKSMQARPDSGSRPATAAAQFKRSATMGFGRRGTGAGAGGAGATMLRRRNTVRKLNSVHDASTLPLEMRRAEWRAPKFHFAAPAVTRFPGGRLEQHRQAKRLQRRADAPFVRHKSAAYAEDAKLDAAEAAAEAARKQRVLKPDFHKIRAEREKLSVQRRLEENEKIMNNFRAKHCK